MTLSTILIALALVSDGDSLKIDGQRIRIHGIDAVELHQQCGKPCWPCGRKAADEMKRILTTPPICKEIDRDRYGRSVSECTAGGKDIGEAMIRSGYAVPYTTFLRGEKLRRYEAVHQEAIRNKRGIHTGLFDRPDRWRKGDRICR